MSNRQGVFISYSKKDAKWLDLLRVHLSYLEREYQFTIWEDSKIEVGADWRDEIYKALSNTKIAILMVSANFIASDFINNEELPALLTAAEQEGAYIFPIIISHCMFSDIDAISKFQTVNPPTEPLVAMDDGQRDALFVKVTQEVKRVLSLPTNDSSSPIVDNLPSLEEYQAALVRASVISVFRMHTEEVGLTIKQVYERSKIERRKNVVRVIHELEALGILTKTKVEQLSYYKITDFGTTFIKEYYTI